MSLAALTARIETIPSDLLAAESARHGDDIRGWWACVAASGTVHIESQVVGTTFAEGAARADVLVDQGSAAVIVHPRGAIGAMSRAIVGLLCDVDATEVVRKHADDLEWMRACADVRDLQAQFRERRADALELVEADVAATAGLLLGLAARRTPAVLIGTAAHAAAVVAQRQSRAGSDWWRSGAASRDPVVRLACARLRYEPWMQIATEIDDDALDDAVCGIIASISV